MKVKDRSSRKRSFSGKQRRVEVLEGERPDLNEREIGKIEANVVPYR
jgi:hypothetical protein